MEAEESELQSESSQNLNQKIEESNAETDINTANKNGSADSDEDVSIQITDRILIESKAYGKVVGRVVYTDDSLLRILPDGVSNRLYDFPIVDNELDPDIGVSEILLDKGPRIPFTDFSGFREGQIVDTYTADGDYVNSYKIISVSVPDDTIVIQDTKEQDPEIKLEFADHGIPRDLPFAVLRIAPLSEEEQSKLSPSAEEEQPVSNEEEGEEFETVGELELPTFMVASELSAKEQIFPDITQKSDFMIDLISMLDAPSQKNSLYLKRIRAFVEMMNTLKHSISKHSDAGQILGAESPSVESLAEILKQASVPLVRPILQTKRILQVDQIIDSEQYEKETDELIIQRLEQTLERVQSWIDGHDSIPGGEVGVDTPRFYQWLQGLLTRFPLGDQAIGTGYQFTKDAEYFRQEAPTLDTVEGLPAVGGDEELQLTDEFVADVSQSLRRGLGPTIRRGPNGGVIATVPATSADTKGYVLFPPTVNRQLGSKRTGTLAEDILRSHSPLEWMSLLVQNLGGVTEEQDASRILVLNAEGNSLANIPFATYLETILPLLTPKGLGDMNTLLKDFGVEDKELTQEQIEVVQTRVEEVITNLRRYIRKLRVPKEVPTVTSNPLFEDSDNAFLQRLNEVVGSIPILQEALSSVGHLIPGYKKIDLAILGYLLTYYPDLTFAALGTNEANLNREQTRVTRDSFLKTLRQAQKIMQNAAEAGVEPIVNPCPHTNTLIQIRKVKEDGERIALLSKFISRFKGGREDNWLTCISCEQNLICHHELLQVQQYLHPREYEVIQKEIVLHYAGGRAGSHFICRNCGQPISELQYDTHIEFDDEGRPMMGRSELVDEDAADEEELLLSLAAPVGAPEEHDFGDERRNQLYTIARSLCDRIGVFLDPEGYKFVIELANQRLSMQPSPQRYAELMGRKKGPDYATHMSRLSISLVACLILVNIQSHVPDYVVRYVLPGCRPGFDGYPLKASADPSTSVGMVYIACALNGITDMSGIWGQTGWQLIRSDKDREATILKQLTTVMQILVEANPAIQLSLDSKRDYLVKIYGKDASKEGIPEKIPDGFLPRIESAAESAESASKEPVVSAGIRSGRGEDALSQAWIRSAHRLANDSARKIEGTPFAETGCCFEHHATPQEFFKEHQKELPPLPSKLTLLRPPARQTWTFVPFKSRIAEIVEAKQSSSIVYRIFMSICWQGDRMGYAHEFGADTQCDWCGLKIPVEYMYPDVDKYGNLIFNDDLLIQSFAEQGIPTSSEAFERLLDIAHARQIFKLYLGPMPVSQQAVLESLTTIQNPPIESWSVRILRTLSEMGKLAPGASDVEIAAAFSSLTEPLSEAEEYCKEVIQSFEITARFPARERIGWNRLLSILEEPSANFIEIVRACILIPCARILTKYNRSNLRVSTFYELSKDHQMDIATILEKHTKVLEILEKTPLDELCLAKLEVFVDQLASYLERSSELKISRIPYGSQLLPYLNRIALLGPLQTLLDPSKIPETADTSAFSGLSSSRDILIRFLLGLLGQYTRERLSYSSEAIRDALARELEKENTEVIQFFGKMSEEEKRVELMKKRLGLGRWSIGGTKLIWAYNQDQYDKERADNMEAYETNAGPDGIEPGDGVIDFAAMGGGLDYGDAYDDANNGYDVEEESPDDF